MAAETGKRSSLPYRTLAARKCEAEALGGKPQSWVADITRGRYRDWKWSDGENLRRLHRRELRKSAKANPTPKRAANAAEIRALTEAFHDSDLRDPLSVQTRRIVVGEDDGVVYSCGQYNAKNAYGAYVGFRPFLALIASGKAKIIGMGSSDSEAYATASV